MQTRDELQAECSHWRETAERLSARRDELERRIAELEEWIEELETEISKHMILEPVFDAENRLRTTNLGQKVTKHLTRL